MLLHDYRFAIYNIAELVMISLVIIRTYGSFTMETILATAFGRVVDIQRGESDDLTRAVDSIFRGVQEGGSFDGATLITLISELAWKKFYPDKINS